MFPYGDTAFSLLLCFGLLPLEATPTELAASRKLAPSRPQASSPRSGPKSSVHKGGQGHQGGWPLWDSTCHPSHDALIAQPSSRSTDTSPRMTRGSRPSKHTHSTRRQNFFLRKCVSIPCCSDCSTHSLWSSQRRVLTTLYHAEEPLVPGEADPPGVTHSPGKLCSHSHKGRNGLFP